jgi:crotonobetainyl-CoA:carnitine CoA-transferase CaiB-like acyl-CoA transferase
MNLFSNLKVIDVSTVLAGPSVATFFAELGAEVIKVENKKTPDVTRSWKLPNEDKTSTVSAYFSSINYHKKYLSFDFKNAEDYDAFIDLIRDADILISNFKFGDEEKLKLSDAILRDVNPNLIIGKINGFGEESDRVAYDLILQAETGYMSMNGTPESGPVKMPVALIDVLAAHHLKEGLLLGLLNRQQGGTANTITVSLYDAAVSSLVNQASNFLMNNHIPKRIGSLHPNIAPYGEMFKTNNGDLITFAIGSEAHFFKLTTFLGLQEITSDPKFNTNQNRVSNRIELEQLIQAKIELLSTEEILSKMLSENVPVGKIKAMDEVFQSERVNDSVLTEKIDGIETKRLSTIAFKWK